MCGIFGFVGGADSFPFSRAVSLSRPLSGGCNIPLPEISCAASTVWMTLVMLLVADCAAPPSAESPEIVTSLAFDNASAIIGAISGIISICLYRK